MYNKENVSHLLTVFALVFCGVYNISGGHLLWTQGIGFLPKIIMLFSFLSSLGGFLCLVIAASYYKEIQKHALLFMISFFVFTSYARGYNYFLYTKSGYGTDAVIFNGYAADLTLQGRNPYQHSMEPAFAKFNVSKKHHTPDDKAGIVYSLSYPAQSFLLYIPFIVVGLDANWAHLLAYLLSIVFLFILAPPWLRPLTPLVMFFEVELLNFSLGGATDILFLPFLLAMAFFWHRNRLYSAILWGFACGIKQSPWFLAPFIAVALYQELILKEKKQAIIYIAKYFLIAILAFIIPNLPFIFSDPLAWFHGVFTPIMRKLVLHGSGLVSITTFGGLPISRSFYSMLAWGTWFILIVLYFFCYKKMANLLWIFPGIILWFAPRSLHNYFIYWAPVLVLALAWELDNKYDKTQKEYFESWQKKEKYLLAICTLPFLAFTVIAFFCYFDSSLQTKIIYTKDTWGIGAVNEMEIEVENNTVHPISPRFAVTWRGINLFFWQKKDHQPILPKEKKRFTIYPRKFTDTPFIEEVGKIRVYNPNTSKFYLSPSFGPIKRTTYVYNGKFKYWNKSAHTPIRWHRYPPIAYFAKNVIMEKIAGKKALCLQAHRSNQEWSRTTLSQKILSQTKTLRFDYYSPQNPVGWKMPKRVLGVELVFENNQILIISPSSYVTTTKFFPKGRFIFIHLPYTLGKWQNFSLDIPNIWKFLEYKKAPRITLKLIASVHRSFAGKAKAYFTNVAGLPVHSDTALKIFQEPHK